MRAYCELLRYLCENQPELLRQLPSEVIERTADWLLRHGDGYLLEQVDKHVGTVHRLDQKLIVRMMYQALDSGRTDDFCFLLKASGTLVDVARVDTAYQRLARRGNVAGIENIVKASGVPARLDEVSARRAYEVLIATGRLEAADYVRQLSGVPISASRTAVQLGYRVLLLAGRYDGIERLCIFSGMAPELSDSDIHAAFIRARSDLEYSALVAVAGVLKCTARFSGFDECLSELIAAGQYAEIPPLFRLCKDSHLDQLTPDVLTILATSNDATSVSFVYTWTELTALHKEHARHAYQVAVDACDRELLRTVCSTTGHELHGCDAGRFLESAIDMGDTDWISFAYHRTKPVPAPPFDAVQLLLFDLYCRGDLVRWQEMQQLFNVAFDEPLARWLRCLQDGRLDDANNMVNEVADQPAIQAVAEVLAATRGYDHGRGG